MFIFFAAPLVSWLNLTIKWLLLGLACAAAQAIVNIKLALWMVKGAATRYAIFQVAQSVMLAGLTFVMISGFAMGWESRALALVITTFLFFCGSVFMMAKDGECSRKVSTYEIRLALRFGVPLIPHTCGALLFTSVDRFVVNGVLGSAATGLYQLAAQVGSIVMVGTDAINKAFSPWLYRHLSGATDITRRNIVKLTYFYFFAAITSGILFFMLPWNIAALIGGAHYSEAGPLVPYFILGHCIGGMYFMVVNYIFYTGRTGYLSVATLISGLIGLAAVFVLVGYVGVLGAGVAFVISKSIHFLSTWLISSRVFPMPWMLTNPSHKGGIS
jgi:O-antigen/teichoic acid export membrane protein